MKKWLNVRNIHQSIDKCIIFPIKGRQVLRYSLSLERCNWIPKVQNIVNVVDDLERKKVAKWAVPYMSLQEVSKQPRTSPSMCVTKVLLVASTTAGFVSDVPGLTSTCFKSYKSVCVFHLLHHV